MLTATQASAGPCSHEPPAYVRAPPGSVTVAVAVPPVKSASAVDAAGDAVGVATGLALDAPGEGTAAAVADVPVGPLQAVATRPTSRPRIATERFSRPVCRCLLYTSPSPR